MTKSNFLVGLSIKLIKEKWHGSFGRNYNKKHGIICRFYPSCSNYCIMALEKYGFVKGWIKTANRIKRCNKQNTESTIDFP